MDTVLIILVSLLIGVIAAAYVLMVAMLVRTLIIDWQDLSVGMRVTGIFLAAVAILLALISVVTITEV